MKLNLSNFNQRFTFRAIVQGYCLDSVWSTNEEHYIWKPMIMLSNINYQNTDTGLFEYAGEKTCISYTNKIAKLGQLVAGEMIQFNARYVGEYFESLDRLMNPSKFKIIKPLIDKRYPVPASEYLRVGYVMEVNHDKYPDSKMYKQEIVDRYDDWCNTNAYNKKSTATDQSNTET